MQSMIHIIMFGLNLTGKDYGLNCVSLEPDLPLDLLTDTMKVKYDELPPQIPNLDQTNDERLAQRKLRVTSSNSGAIFKRRVSVT